MVGRRGVIALLAGCGALLARPAVGSEDRTRALANELRNELQRTGETWGLLFDDSVGVVALTRVSQAETGHRPASAP